MRIFALNVRWIRGFQQYLEYVSDAKHLQAISYRNRKDAKGTLFAELLLRALVCDQLGLLNSEVELVSGLYGKPALPEAKGFEFNLSHSGDWVVCVVNNTEVGIDLQKIEGRDFDIARFYFSKEEYLDLMNKRGDEKLDYFYELWTLKESFVKLKGTGFSQPLADFRIRSEWDGIRAFTASGPEPVYFKLYDFVPGYKLAVCSLMPEFAEQIEIKKVDWIMKVLGLSQLKHSG